MKIIHVILSLSDDSMVVTATQISENNTHIGSWASKNYKSKGREIWYLD